MPRTSQVRGIFTAGKKVAFASLFSINYIRGIEGDHKNGDEMKKTRVKIHPILQELKQELRTLYGARLRNIILFGSYARGEATPESDMDVLLVLEKVRNSSKEAGLLVPLLAELNLKYGILLACLPIDLAEYKKGTTPLLRNVQREGVLIHG